MSTTIMPATIQTNLHLDPDQFAEAKQILSQLGMSFGEAVNIFINLIVVKHGLPFDIALPNEETKSVMLDVRAKQDLETITFEQFQQSVYPVSRWAKLAQRVRKNPISLGQYTVQAKLDGQAFRDNFQFKHDET